MNFVPRFPLIILFTWSTLACAFGQGNEISKEKENENATEIGIWSRYRGNDARQGFFSGTGLFDGLGTAESSTSATLSLQWQYQPAQPPSPAWGPPAPRSYWQQLESIEPRVTDDRRFAVVADQNRVYFGSSADDQVRAINVKTGEVSWTFSAGGPVRYAPALSSDAERIYFSSDDGFLYALDAVEGRLIWKRNIAGSDRLIVGNGRMISEFPSRTGVALVKDQVFVGAGLYPQQGCFFAAYAAEDGREIWRQSIEDSPQGYLLAGAGQLIVPTGRGNPIAVSMEDGRLLHRYTGVGGTYAVLTEDELIAGRGNDGSLAVSDASSHERLVQFQGRHLVVTPTRSYLAGADGLMALDRLRYMRLNREILKLTAQARALKVELQKATEAKNEDLVRNRLSALETASNELRSNQDQLPACVIWKRPDLSSISSMVATSEALVVGGNDETLILSTADGKLLQRLQTESAVVDIAVTSKALILSLESGELQCWASSGEAEAKKAPITKSATISSLEVEQNGTDASAKSDSEVSDKLHEATLAFPPLRKGFGLIHFPSSPDEEELQLAKTLLNETELKWVWVVDDETDAQKLRSKLLKRGIYGSQAHVMTLDSMEELPFSNYLFNWIWMDRSVWHALNSESQLEWTRVCRPAGGQIWSWTTSSPESSSKITLDSLYQRSTLEGSGSWTHQYADPANTSDAKDQLIRPPFKVQWFGGPGPDRMVDRHLRGPGPLAYEGRLIVPGENQFIAVDAYNGEALWRFEAPGSQRYTLPFDAPYYGVSEAGFFLASSNRLLWIDSDTGKQLAAWAPPISSEESEDLLGDPAIAAPGSPQKRQIHWGYVAPVADGAVLASLQWSDASRTQPSRDLINVDYSNRQPIVTSQAVLRWNPKTESREWIYGEGRILNTTFTASSDQLTFLESQTEAVLASNSGRISMAQFNSPEQTRWVHLDTRTGQVLWQKPLGKFLSAIDNMIYLSRSGNVFVAVGSLLNEAAMDTEYRIEAFDAQTGETIWRQSHLEGKPRAFSHGEQNHHPVLLGSKGWVIAEPYAYRLKDGIKLTTDLEGKVHWKLVRPGHSCGTITAGAECLFFRADNPTSLDMSQAFRFAEEKILAPGRSDQISDWKFEKLAPTRPGCWINIIPAGGLALIPEASSGCVCHYSLQTSMAFLPVGQTLEAP